MRYAAALPSAALLSGAAYGLFFETPEPARVTSMAIAAAVATAVVAIERSRSRHPPTAALAAVCAFFVGGVFLSTDAWERAWRPPLRVRFEEAARRERAEAEASHQRRPLDDEASLTL